MRSVVIIGAGAAGLHAARILSGAGLDVTVLEGRDRIGGRIFTSREKEFSVPVENGAEFIHGDPPLSRALAREAGVKTRTGTGTMWAVRAGEVKMDDPFDESWQEFISLLDKLEVDIPIAEFLETRFKGDYYASLRESVTNFVQGFDAADATRASSFALRDEWASGDALTGSHLTGGYSTLMEFLRNACVTEGVVLKLGAHVNKIRWTSEEVVVDVASGDRFRAEKCIVTVPPAVLRSGAITFEPLPEGHLSAIQKIETGGVVKFLFEFDDVFWDSTRHRDLQQFADMHFIFSDAVVPTWWSQQPSKTPLLTGWFSGPVTRGLTHAEETLRSYAVDSLAYIFKTTNDRITSMVRGSKVVNWQDDPYARGAYAYRTVDTPVILKTLSQPVNDVIYFAGEAYYTGNEMGTVEAALASGKETAEIILDAK